MLIPIDELQGKVLATLTKRFSQEDSIRIAEYLIWAEMSGIKTQGILKLTGTEPLQKIEPRHPIKIERETKLSQLINAGAHPAPLVSQIATDVVIKKAKEQGFGLVGVHNTFSSNGAQAFYAERIAKADLIGIVLARSPGATAPFNSISPLFGTNPIGFSFPTLADPLVFDMATSAMTYYGLVLAKSRGEEIPDNMAVDAEGNPTKDPNQAMQGALLPFDRSYKGSGIGMVVEILAGPLLASAYCDCVTFDKEWGATFIAIDPSLLVELSEFKRHCTQLIEIIKSSKKKAEAIRLPGERARNCYNQAKASGMVDIDERLLMELGYR